MRKMLMIGAAPLLLGGVLAAGPALASAGAARNAMAMANTFESRTDRASAQEETVNNAMDVVAKMRSDPAMDALLKRAKGLFIIPGSPQGMRKGVAGAEGVLLAHTGFTWTKPAFYTVGALKFGTESGNRQGAVALVLMTGKALHSFTKADHFNIDANAGLTVVDYRAKRPADLNTGDVVAWSDMAGMFAGAKLRASNIRIDKPANQAFYGGLPSVSDILNGRTTGLSGQFLQNALPA